MRVTLRSCRARLKPRCSAIERCVREGSGTKTGDETRSYWRTVRGDVACAKTRRACGREGAVLAGVFQGTRASKLSRWCSDCKRSTSSRLCGRVRGRTACVRPQAVR